MHFEPLNNYGILASRDVDKKSKHGRDIFLFNAYKFSRLRSRALFTLCKTKDRH